MHLPRSFAAAGLVLLTGFTFANHTDDAKAFPGIPSYSDVLANAYEASRDVVAGEVGTVLAVEFPETFDATARIEALDDGTFLVRSWVRTQRVTGAVATIPWHARVRCLAADCAVEQATLEHAQTL